MKLLNTFLLILAVGLLAACRLESGAEGGPLPRQKALRDGAVADQLQVSFELSAPIWCAEVGAPVSFRLYLKNNLSVPVTLLNTLDIVIHPDPTAASGSLPITKWSETKQYPQGINLRLEPGEEREYHWTWVADPIYETDDLVHNWVEVTSEVKLRDPESLAIVGTDARFQIGVGAIRYGLGAIPCSEMRQ